MTDDYWQQAWECLCQRRQKAPAGADIWHLQFHWEQQMLPGLIREVEAGTYCLSPM